MTHQPSKDSLRDLRLETAKGSSPKVTFPCAYSLKVVGDAGDDFVDLVTAIILRHDPTFDPADAQVVDSRNGRFQSVRLTINASGEAQLKALFDELKATGQVHMVI
ncbi:YbeD family protein [Pistricoccus aurantiacus]|uniref:HP0495 family protein n=1 Tax=Pistricoccus aurantiacus TaxID=1883414 RepID=UPI00362F0698